MNLSRETADKHAMSHDVGTALVGCIRWLLDRHGLRFRGRRLRYFVDVVVAVAFWTIRPFRGVRVWFSRTNHVDLDAIPER
jgi:hypothetical protein